MNKKIKCDIYTRVSTTMQVDGYSLDAQKEKLKRYAEFQNMEIVNEYSDEGKSGKSVEGRAEFQRMLDNIENGTDAVSYTHLYRYHVRRSAGWLIYSYGQVASVHPDIGPTLDQQGGVCVTQAVIIEGNSSSSLSLLIK